jgi:hypothetical protein
MDIVKTLTSALTNYESDRDKQVEIGASSIGGCRAQAWHIINQTPTTNHDTENLASLMGTAIHSIIEEAMRRYDLFGDDFILEKELNGVIKGHCDFYSQKNKFLADWKTVTLEKMKGGWKPTKQQKIQVNLYAYLYIQEGYEVETVALVAIPRDGRKRDIQVWQEPYNEKYALEGIAWLEEVKKMDSAPLPERPKFFCANYCNFYDQTGAVGCQGK